LQYIERVNTLYITILTINSSKTNNFTGRNPEDMVVLNEFHKIPIKSLFRLEQQIVATDKN